MPTRSRQLVLDFGLRPALGRGDFVVAPCNEAAVAWIDRWPDWPAPGLVIYGPAACGKSHLAAVWQAQAGAATASIADIVAGRAPAESRLVIEGAADGLADRIAAEALFHLFNRLHAARLHMLFPAETPPARWPVALPDLLSRLVALPAVEIGAPDDAMLSRLFVKLFAERQLAVSADIIAYLVRRIERSCAAVRQTVETIDRVALTERRTITVPFIRDLLGWQD
jgi:chromosomal replication initiation ATPase DnaA